jgi:116 kDa U5 small nuclear ribonucleoprotein component
MDDDLYDEFGNFIGDVEASEEESEHGIDAGNYAYDDEFPEAASEHAGQELMEVDGQFK